MPGPLGICVPFVFSLVVCTLLAGRTLSLTRLSISVMASQTLFHTLFVLGTPAQAFTATTPQGGAHQHGPTTFEFAATAAPATDQVLAHVHGDATMWVSHFVGAVITIAFLYRGERALVRLWELAEHLVTQVRLSFTAVLHPATLITAAPRREPRLEAPYPVSWSVLSHVTSTALSRRGPPVVRLTSPTNGSTPSLTKGRAALGAR